MGKQLNLKWVSEVIGDSYKDWNNGDVITINAQTGTGKTYFITGDKNNKGLIDNIADGEVLLYLCNRVELKNQIKLDLLEKYNMSIPYELDKGGNCVLDANNKEVIDAEVLNKINRIGNVVIKSYHEVAESILDKEFLDCNFSFDYFKYIVCDECHFFLTDASFNNKAYFTFKELIETKIHNAVRIFISATMDEIKVGIKKYNESVIEYDTGRDYSYLNVKYFQDIDDIGKLIKNDTTDEKWLVFISNKEQGNRLKELLDGFNIINSFITATSKTNESKNITQYCKFDCKVLISTKCLDNGVNIKDENLKNLVVIATDKTTFIQEIGRVRFEITDAPEINLYINKSYKKTFTTRMARIYKPKMYDLNLFNGSLDSFKRKYNNALDKVPHDIFNQDMDNNWRTNDVGIVRLDRDIKFANYIIDKFEDEWAFIKEQLSWIGLENTFNENRFIKDVSDNEDALNLSKYLSDLFENKVVFLQSKDRVALIEYIGLIDKHNSNLGIKKDKEISINYIKNITTLNSYLKEDLCLEYSIKQFETSRVINGIKKKFKQAWKIVKTIE